MCGGFIYKYNPILHEGVRHPLILVSTGYLGTSPFWMARDDCIHSKVKPQMHTAYIHSLLPS